MGKINDYIQNIKNNFSSKKILLFFVGFLIIVTFLNIFKQYNNETQLSEFSSINQKMLEDIDPELDNKKIEQIAVSIVGNIKKPGMYWLSNDSRVQDLVNRAGGFTKKADMKCINLAKKLADGEQITIFSIFENKNNLSLSINKKEKNTENKININKASESEIVTLDGIGKKTAEKIINWREMNGPFAAIENIMDVAGIGISKFENIKAKITV